MSVQAAPVTDISRAVACSFVLVDLGRYGTVVLLYYLTHIFQAAIAYFDIVLVEYFVVGVGIGEMFTY